MDADFVDSIKGMTLAASQASTQSGQTINQNLSQGLGVVQTLVTQAQSSNSDDPAVIAALQTASRSPAGQA